MPIVTVLLGTGMRIGECLGLRWEDLDFENRMISVNHNLTDRSDSQGRCGKHIQTPKTEAGTRIIPMIQEVYEACMSCSFTYRKRHLKRWGFITLIHGQQTLVK